MARSYQTLVALARRDREWSDRLARLVAEARESKPTRGELYAEIENAIRDMVSGEEKDK